MPAPRLIDVAEAAGVSRATASRVLAGTPRNVDPELARRVAEAARRLGYRTNHSARALRTGTTGTVGVVVPSLANPYFVQLADSIARRVRAAGGTLVLSDAANDPGIEAEQIDALLSGPVDGLLVVPVSAAESGPALRKAATRRPVVLFDRWAEDSGTVAVTLDNAAAVRLLVEHLRGIGRDRIALVAADQASSSGAERLAAFTELLGKDATTILQPSFTTDAGRTAARRIVEERDRVDAVVCGADVLAVGLVTALHRASVSVPDEIAVTGFDDTEILRLLDPPLTSIRHPLSAMAERALSLLAAPVRQRAERVERFAPRLVVRASTDLGH
ncbi:MULTISPECIES: LacI family DNA-binding transcriptional regulator [unclassified Streptomyces]|uniref:LacI family DNA-binding transcriptional regulator n=1 Tax=unclassified Streptomyces TaxID=2593676 RepID=UPI000DADDC22|nr:MULTISPECIES: LacI family DNA-binding transcriptional regulator [unclassified Streptomyces]PZT78037.1 LacI family transcriptional regulator [Streptomyces sp. AC1-42W]PZT80584.1 LacI family transcriptional regulator [Streptomyces sp. AC1-42T]